MVLVGQRADHVGLVAAFAAEAVAKRVRALDAIERAGYVTVTVHDDVLRDLHGLRRGHAVLAFVPVPCGRGCPLPGDASRKADFDALAVLVRLHHGDLLCGIHQENLAMIPRL
jgi:hypothetical protein